MFEINISKIHDHDMLLQKELREAKEFVQYLNFWSERASLDGSADPNLIRQHQKIIQNQAEFIQNRIALLEQIAEKMSLVIHSADRQLDEARDTAVSVLR